MKRVRVRAIKPWYDYKNEKWISVGDEIETEHPLAYIDAGIAVPIRARQIETQTRTAPEKQVTR